MKFRLSNHAKQEATERGLSQEVVDDVLEHPQQVVPTHGGRKVYQSKVRFPGGKIYVVRAIVKEDVDPAVVVTVYRTSKIQKYWRRP